MRRVCTWEVERDVEQEAEQEVEQGVEQTFLGWIRTQAHAGQVRLAPKVSPFIYPLQYTSSDL